MAANLTADLSRRLASVSVTRRSLGAHVATRVWAISDQGFFAGTTFLINLGVARQLGPEAYGTFALALTVFAFLSSIYSAVLIEPLLVFGAGAYADRLRRYLGALIYGHCAICLGVIIIGGLTGVALSALGFKMLASICVGLVILSPANLVFLLLRRACFVASRPGLAASAGLVYLCFSVALLATVRLSSTPSLRWALMISSVGCLPSILWLFFQLRVSFPPVRDRLIREALKSHWSYGRWSIRSSFLRWVPANSLPWFVAAFVGAAGAGEFRATLNLLTPCLQALNSLAGLLVPKFVRAKDAADLRGKMLRNGLVFLAAAACYSTLLIVFRVPVLHGLYRGRYDGSAVLFTSVALIAIPESAIQIFTAAFQAMSAPEYIFFAYIVSSLVTVVCGLIGVANFGVAGACYGMLFSYIASAAALFAFWKRYIERRAGSGIPCV